MESGRETSEKGTAFGVRWRWFWAEPKWGKGKATEIRDLCRKNRQHLVTGEMWERGKEKEERRAQDHSQASNLSDWENDHTWIFSSSFSVRFLLFFCFWLSLELRRTVFGETVLLPHPSWSLLCKGSLQMCDMIVQWNRGRLVLGPHRSRWWFKRELYPPGPKRTTTIIEWTHISS